MKEKILIHLICAARPNFMKVAPLYHALKTETWADTRIVHTGQHYDLNMSDVFFKDLQLPAPHVHLGVGSGSHAEQTAKVMIAYEKILLEERPDLVVVVGDVNSTAACTLAASKINFGHVPPSPSLSTHLSVLSTNPILSTQHSSIRRPLVAHLEAGLRSFDRSMPEEINRIVTDALADLLWTPSEDAVENLIREGVSPDKIQTVGNIMIDSLELLRAKIEEEHTYREFNQQPQGYGLVTLHRPSNVDDPESLSRLCEALLKIAKKIPLVFPIHPRTRKNLQQNNLLQIIEDCKGLFLPDPINYIRFMNLVFNCRFVITDSGGIQEETTHLGIPCLTMRPNTERPVTITRGTNQLCTVEELENKAGQIISGRIPKTDKIEYWDGKTAIRIRERIKNVYGSQLTVSS